ncbi:hypothetical protein BBP40_012432 [Aspergillus hancockii]|nr:hypothetical protein BBP40_012432 [Aspergillus hancockii]
MQPDNDLVFVNVSHPDQVRSKKTQLVIRRRVMRDIGKSRRKRKWAPPAVTFAWQPLGPPTPSLNSHPLPVELNSRSLQLIHFMQAESEYNYRPFRAVWFSMALQDHSAFKLCMANAAMFLDEATHPETFQYENSREALTYYGQCVGQITERLGNPADCTSQGVITTVLGMICHDLYVGTFDRWAYHIRGLNQIMLLRGGFHGLNSNLHLFASWFDVLGSVIRDAPPQISICPMDITTQAIQKDLQRPFLGGLLRSLTESYNPSRPIVTALNRVAAVSDFVNSHYHHFGFWKQEDDLSPLEILTPATHTLLSMLRFEAPNLGPFEYVHEMTRLALLILLAELKIVYSLTANEIPLLRTKFADLLRRTNCGPDGAFLFPRLQLWALTTVALLQPPGPERELGITRISDLMPTLSLPDGQAVSELARNIIWIEVLAQTDIVQSLVSDIDIARSID